GHRPLLLALVDRGQQIRNRYRGDDADNDERDEKLDQREPLGLVSAHWCRPVSPGVVTSSQSTGNCSRINRLLDVYFVLARSVRREHADIAAYGDADASMVVAETATWSIKITHSRPEGEILLSSGPVTAASRASDIKATKRAPSWPCWSVWPRG